MDGVVDLDQSPIQCDEDEQYDSDRKQSDSEDEELFGGETFKGSFLQEMEKLCKPLKYERKRLNIYESFEEQQSQNFLHQVDLQPKKQQVFDFSFKHDDQGLILDFSQKKQAKCTCCCHNRVQQRKYSLEGMQNCKKQVIKSKKQLKGQFQQPANAMEKKNKEAMNNWTSLSLKQYKLRIKKKLMQKR